MIHTIVTHPGGAHKDDLLAVSVVIARTGAQVFRRDPSPSDLEDPGVAVLDIGGSHDPARSNFDHHQLPADHAPSSALSLVLRDLGLYDDALRFCDWLETAEWFDSRGPNRTAAWLGVPPRVVSQLGSPVEDALLRRFAQRRSLAPGEPLYEVMRFIGEDLLEFLRRIRERIAFVAEHAERWTIPAGEEAIEAIFLPRLDGADEDAGEAIEAFIRDRGLERSIAALVYPDRRGRGYGLRRYEDHPRLDFSRVEGEPDVHFAHKTGFLCKTSATDPARLRELVRGGWVPVP
jgi:GNAT superfamily N-acetyltransferase